MLTAIAIVRAKTGKEGALRGALLEVAGHVKQSEPGTLAYVLSQDKSDPCVFTVFERFADETAMKAHLEAEYVARYFAVTEDILDAVVSHVVCDEMFAKL